MKLKQNIFYLHIPGSEYMIMEFSQLSFRTSQSCIEELFVLNIFIFTSNINLKNFSNHFKLLLKKNNKFLPVIYKIFHFPKR